MIYSDWDPDQCVIFNVLHLSKVISETKRTKVSRCGSFRLQLLGMLVQVQLPWLQKWMDYYSEQEPKKVCDESTAGMTLFLRSAD